MMHTTTRRNLDEIDRELMDPEQWDDEPVTLTAAPNRTLTLGLRLSRDELRVLSAGSDATNLMLSDYIKRAALAATKAGLDIDTSAATPVLTRAADTWAQRHRKMRSITGQK